MPGVAHSLLLQSLLAFPGPSIAGSTVPTPDQAVERQREAVLEAVRPCEAPVGEDEIVVCGRRSDEGGGAGPGGYVPRRSLSAPEEGPWFQIGRGPLSISCCSISTARGSGAGLSLRIRF